MNIYAVFCKTPIGDCVCLLPSISKADAEEKAKDWLFGEDIEDVTVTKTEHVKPDEEVCVFWDYEVEGT